MGGATGTLAGVGAVGVATAAAATMLRTKTIGAFQRVAVSSAIGALAGVGAVGVTTAAAATLLKNKTAGAFRRAADQGTGGASPSGTENGVVGIESKL